MDEDRQNRMSDVMRKMIETVERAFEQERPRNNAPGEKSPFTGRWDNKYDRSTDGLYAHRGDLGQISYEFETDAPSTARAIEKIVAAYQRQLERLDRDVDFRDMIGTVIGSLVMSSLMDELLADDIVDEQTEQPMLTIPVDTLMRTIIAALQLYDSLSEPARAELDADDEFNSLMDDPPDLDHL